MASDNIEYTLYYYTYSICSLMVRYSLACRGSPKTADQEIVVNEQEIDLTKREQFTEHFLCDINANGESQVPVLLPAGGRPIPDSVDITLYLATFYSTLAPAEYKAEIERLLRALHTINFFSLTFTGKPQAQIAAKTYLNDLLGEKDISERYRLAIEHKLRRIQDQKLGALSEKNVEDNIRRARLVMSEFESILHGSQSGWCFGLEHPSALDAHLLVFVARMQDVGREELIPDGIRGYAARAFETDEWKTVMQGRRTMPPGWFAKSS